MNNSITDFHTHILPGIDDGSRNPDMTMAMLREEAAQGVGQVVATPHFYAHRNRIGQFLEKRDAASAEVASLRRTDPSLPKVLLGAEVYYFSGIGSADRIRDLCVEGTDILLLEMPFAQWDEEVVRDVKNLIRRQHVKVLLAHIDRYWGLQKRKDPWDAIMAMPLIRQINADSVLSRGSARRFSLKFMKEHGRLILASDCHNITSRAPNLKQARTLIVKKLGDGVLNRMDETAESLLNR